MAGAAAAASQSRLDRLVTLLDSGSTPSIRATAARQLGQIAALRVRGSNTGGRGGESGCGNSRRRNGEAPAGSPVILKEEAREYLDDQSSVDDNDKASTSREGDRVAGTGGSISMYRGVDGDWEQAVFLIARVLPHLRSKTWDTRIAAGQAMEAIAAACGIWDPDVDVGVGVLNTHASHSSGNTEQATDLLTFATFSLPQVLATGKKLLSSAGNEYDQPIFASVEERLAHAKKDMQRLGLGSMAGEEVDLGVDVEKELMAEVKNESPKSAKISKLPPPRFAATSGGIAALPPPQYSPSITTMPSPLGAPMAKNEKPSETVSTPRVALPSSSSTEEIDASKLSARERNQLKRKRKMEDKAMANGSAGAAGDASMAAKTRVMEQSPVSSPNNDLKFKVPANLAVHTTNDNDLASSPSPIPATPRTPAGSHVPSDSLDIKTASNEVLATPNTPQGIADLTAGGRATAATATSLVPLPHQWPFTLVCSLLLADLFSPKWEVRHGAALGLRELFKTQGYGGGRLQGGPKVAKENGEIKLEDQDFSSTDVEDNELRHLRWCEDASIRLLCVLSLDRLGDFVFDHVIAPVRETAGQTMASLLRWMPDALIWKVHSVLLDMVRQEYLVKAANGDVPPTDGLQAKRSVPGYVWEVRHAGLLGLKYEVTIREDLLLKDGEASPMLTSVVDLSILCLHDDDDDVRGVAAATLLPVVHQLVEYMPHAISSLMEQLWACLSNLKDDLSSSTSGVMDLLAKMVESPKVIPHLLDHSLTSIPTLIPRLFPFLRHTITSVRLAVLNALRAFLDIPHLSKGWIDDRLVRLLFQNLIVEERESIREASRTTWHRVLDILGEDESRLVSITKPHLETFFTILMTQLGAPIDFSLFYVMPSGLASRDAYNVDKGVLTQDLTLVGVDTVIRGRLGAAQGLGSIMALWPMADDTSFFEQAITHYLSRTSALQKCLAAVVVQEWAYAASAAKEETPLNSTIVDAISARLISILDSPAPATYSEMGVMLQRIQSQCHGVYNFFIKEAKVPKAKVPSLPTVIDTLGQSSAAFTIDSAKNVMSTGYDGLLQLVAAKNRKLVLPGLEERRRKLIADVGFYQTVKEKQDTQVGATVAGAAIALQRLPAKLNPVIRSIMNSVKFEENLDLQQRSARAVADFIAMCSLPSAKANPSEKIIRNLCAFVCQDTTQTAIFDTQQAGIRSMNETPAARSSSGKVGRPAADKGEMAMTEEVRQGKLIRRGAELALQAVADKFKENLFSTVPSMWACMAGPLVGLSKLTEEEQEASQASTGQSIIDCCTLVEVNVKNLHGSLKGQALELIDPHIRAIASPFSVIRGAAAKSLAAMADCFTEEVMLTVVEKVVPLLGAATSVARRQGAIETLSQIVATLELKLLPYVIVLVVPVLGRMSDPDDSIRLVATNTFASLVKMVPLEAGLPDPPGFSQELLDRREGEREFLAQLLDGNKVEKYEIPVKINAQLRKYQQDGVNWMTFLAKFQLHGILCDDMGLGKTLQSICILASRHYEYEQSRKSDVEGKPHLSSLIVCPPTLTGHWCHEIKQYSNNLQPLLYAGQPQERLRLQSRIAAHDCIVMSYDTLRNDIGFLSQLDWFYCILDEGHIIKSGKAKTTKAVKMIKSVHRLILSGTPIQNNVLELWSLFDFLMPGFLGNEKAFMERYGRPILASKDAKVTAREHERASLALEALHKQVLPFLLRRMKEDVLDDLPPKIIQDISCDLGEVQKQLYEEYIREQDPDALQEALVADENVQGAGEDKKQHVFQTLQYLRKLVCHPLLVFDRNKPKHRQIEEALQKKGGQLRNIDNAPKLLALKQLLNDCGIGVQGQNNGTESSLLDPEEDAGVSQHRVLVFCQQRQMLDLIEKDLFQQVMPSVSYMRLDGSVSSDRRFAMVQRFNSDPSLDVLLLTTSVGGLGLTLTGADTVIFVEHDWNPMKDLQAMDRAHRLGQKKVVNVYRLITKNTLEEKIMGLQRFKINVAGSIVNQENKTMDSMETDQLLDLFDVDGQDAAPEWTKKGEAAANQDKKTKGVSQKVLLANIEAMQDTGDDYNDLKDWKG